MLRPWLVLVWLAWRSSRAKPATARTPSSTTKPGVLAPGVCLLSRGAFPRGSGAAARSVDRQIRVSLVVGGTGLHRWQWEFMKGASWRRNRSPWRCWQDSKCLQAAAPQPLALGGIGSTGQGEVEGKRSDPVPLLHPAHPPAHAGSRGVLPAGFGMQAPAGACVHPCDLGHLLLGSAGEGEGSRIQQQRQPQWAGPAVPPPSGCVAYPWVPGDEGAGQPRPSLMGAPAGAGGSPPGPAARLLPRRIPAGVTQAGRPPG